MKLFIKVKDGIALCPPLFLIWRSGIIFVPLAKHRSQCSPCSREQCNLKAMGYSGKQRQCDYTGGVQISFGQ